MAEPYPVGTPCTITWNGAGRLDWIGEKVVVGPEFWRKGSTHPCPEGILVVRYDSQEIDRWLPGTNTDRKVRDSLPPSYPIEWMRPDEEFDDEIEDEREVVYAYHDSQPSGPSERSQNVLAAPGLSNGPAR